MEYHNKVFAQSCERMDQIPDGVVQVCVTSPPHFGLRDYGVDGQIGLESSLDEYVSRIVEVFREVRRTLRDDGILWLNLGDSYGCKQLLGTPWRVALALQADGWWLRSDIVWSKPNPMPSSVVDRCTTSHEYIFMLSKSERYFFDANAIAEPAIHAGEIRVNKSGRHKSFSNSPQAGFSRDGGSMVKDTRNKRDVWSIALQPYSDAHFATFPREIPSLCIRAGSKPGDLVLDPFMGSGTTAEVAESLGRKWVGYELNPEYHALISQRTAQKGLFSS